VAVADVASFVSLLKTLYPDYAVKRVVYRQSPLNALIPKDENFFGKDYALPIIIEGNSGYSANIVTAQNAADPLKSEVFTLTRTKFYGIMKIARELLLAATDKRGAFQGGLQSQAEGIFYSLARQLTFDLYGDQKGYLAQIKTGTAVTGPTATLSNPTDTIWFQRGQTYNLVDPAAGGGAGVARTGTLTCTAVNRVTGTVTFSANVNSVSGAAALDMFVVADTFGVRMAGLKAWMPTTVTSTPFFGVDRTKDSRLSGQIVDATALSLNVFQAIQEASKVLYREGGRPDVVLLNPNRYQDLLDYLEAKSVKCEQVYVSVEDVVRAEKRSKDGDMDSHAGFGSDEGGVRSKIMSAPGFAAVTGFTANIGYSGILINGQTGPLAVYSDPSCPVSEGYVLQTDTWRLCTLKGAPALHDDDDNWILRVGNDDSYEMRAGWYGQLGCRAPGFNARIVGLKAT
jgi:hypothetical protein